MANSIVLPPPYKGENYQIPKVVIQSPYCERMLNFKPDIGAALIRNGNDMYRNVVCERGLTLDSYSKATPEFFIMIQEVGSDLIWYNAGTGATVLTKLGKFCDFVFTLYFNGYLMYFGDRDMVAGGSVGPQYYDGTAWGALTYTWPTAFNPYGGCVHKNRAYFVRQSESKYGYSKISAVSGTVTEVVLDDIVSSKCELYLIKSISLTENIVADNVLSFIFSNGEVLVYSGSYPDSPSWSLVSRFQISAPIFNNSAIDAKGDSFILTKSEILSIRNLYVSGYAQERATGIGSAIQPRWQQIVDKWLTVSGSTIVSYFNGIYDQTNDRLIINTPGYVDPETNEITEATLQLVYDFRLGSWYEYSQNATSSGGTAIGNKLCYHNGSSYWNGYDGLYSYIVELEGKTDFLDDELAPSGTKAMDYELITAPLPINKYGATAIDGVEMIVKSDLYPQTNVSFIADLGRQETDAQPLIDQGTTITKPMYNVGINGASVVQMKVSGSTVSGRSVGLEIYSINVWYNEGARGSR